MKSPERISKILSLIDDALATVLPWMPSSDSDSSPSSSGADGRTSEAGEKVGADLID